MAYFHTLWKPFEYLYSLAILKVTSSVHCEKYVMDYSGIFLKYNRKAFSLCFIFKDQI